MNQDVLNAIKQELSKFYGVVSTVTTHFDNPHYIVIEVLLQNIAVNAEGTKGYSFEQAVEELHNAQRILKKLADYYNSYFEKWVSSEVDMIVEGYCNSKDIKSLADENEEKW